MRLRLRFLGRTIASFTWDSGPALIILEDTEEAPEGITGVGNILVERDLDPLNPSGEEPWPWADDRRLGFH